MEKNKEVRSKKVIINKYRGGHSSSPIYGMGVIGALFYFLPNAVGFNAVLFAIGKAFFWPAVVLYQVLGYLKI